jgi:hypothetical protein
MIDKRGRLTTVQDVHTFVLAGKATLTLVSEKTGARYTYKVTRIKAEDDPPAELWFVKVMYGPDNEEDFVYIGCIRPNTGFYPTRKSKLAPDDIRVRTWKWFWNKISMQRMPDKVEVWHEGRCCRCGRKLTVPASIDNGIGPECMKHFGPVKREPELNLGQLGAAVYRQKLAEVYQQKPAYQEDENDRG